MRRDLRPGIVRILGPVQDQQRGQTVLSTAGTGFVVDDGRLVVTCAHVVEGARSGPGSVLQIVAHASGKKLAALVDPDCWRPSKAQDVAILRLQEPLPEGTFPLALGSSDGADGPTFRTFGFPADSPIEGAVAKLEVVGPTTQDGFPVLQVRSTEVTLGFSGAPALDTRTDRVVGMVSAIARPDAWGRMVETAYIIPSETLREACPTLALQDVCPYRSLDSFAEDDTDYFFGREQVVTAMLQNLRRLPGYLAVLGPSGSGKSSAVHAGLIPGLRNGKLVGSGGWEIVVIDEYDDPFARIEAVGLVEAGTGLVEAVKGWLARHPDRARLVLVLDQFEELLMVCPEPLRRRFLVQLTQLLGARLEVTVVVVMRDDFYSHLAEQAPELLHQLQQGGVYNVPQTLERGDVIDIIEGPAKVVGLEFQDGLVEEILDDAMETVSSQHVDDGAGTAPPEQSEQKIIRSTVLPLLEFALTQLWERRKDGCLTHQAYVENGRVAGGLARWADEAYNSLNPGLRPVAERVLTDLVYPGDTSQGIPYSRRRRQLTDLYRNDGEREAVVQVVETLASRRLLVTSGDLESGQVRVELIHDAVLREWGDLQSWLGRDRRFLLWQDDVARRARVWAESNSTDRPRRDQGRLLRARDLAEARDYLQQRPADLRPLEREFVEDSIALQTREEEANQSLLNTLQAPPTAGLKHVSLSVAAVLILLLLVQSLGLFTRPELAAYDLLFQVPRLHHSIPTNVAIVKVDDELAATPSWMARAIDGLHRAHAQAIGIYVAYFNDLSPRDDRVLAGAIRRAGNVVLMDRVKRDSPNSGISNTTLYQPSGSLTDSHPGEGISNLQADSDSVYRALDLFQTAPDSTASHMVPYPAFAVELARIAGGRRLSDDRIAHGLPQRHMLINFVGGQDSFIHHQFSGLAKGGDAGSLFRNKIVLIAPASTADREVETPVGQMYEGEVQANALATILQQDPIRSTGSVTNDPIALLVGLLAAAAASRSRLWQSAVGSLAVAAGFALAGYLLFALGNVWIHLILPEMAILLSYVAVMASRVAAGERQRRLAMSKLRSGAALDVPLSTVLLPDQPTRPDHQQPRRAQSPQDARVEDKAVETTPAALPR